MTQELPDINEPYNHPFDIEEKVQMDDFLVEYISDSNDTITVNALFLQDTLRELNKLKIENKKLISEKLSTQRSLEVLRSRIESLNVSMEVMKLRSVPKKINVRRILDVSI